MTALRSETGNRKDFQVIKPQELDWGIPKFVLDIIRRWHCEKRTDQLILNFHNDTIGSVQFFKMRITDKDHLDKTI